ncbi:MAG: alpha/beta hydrolase, partial [Alphaproteobacteria bacterium]
EGEAYASKLERAGVRVHLRRAEGQIHGFFSLASMLPSARAAASWGTGRLSHEFELAAHAAPSRSA